MAHFYTWQAMYVRSARPNGPDIRMSGPFSVADAPYKGVPPLRGLRRYPHAPAGQEHPLFPKASVPVQRV